MRQLDRAERLRHRRRRADLRRYVRRAPLRRRQANFFKLVLIGDSGFGEVVNGQYSFRIELEKATMELLSGVKFERVCPRCGAKGDFRPCVTPSGKSAAKPHKGRFDDDAPIKEGGESEANG